MGKILNNQSFRRDRMKKIYPALRKANKYVKAWRKQKAGAIMSPVRRINYVAPLQQRVCAMTFDDGPSAAPCRPTNSKGLTGHILDILQRYQATASFLSIGSTKENYPDQKGALHSFYAFGTKYDHYPCFGEDDMAGVAACPDLLRRISSRFAAAAYCSRKHLRLQNEACPPAPLHRQDRSPGTGNGI